MCGFTWYASLFSFVWECDGIKKFIVLFVNGEIWINRRENFDGWFSIWLNKKKRNHGIPYKTNMIVPTRGHHIVKLIIEYKSRWQFGGTEIWNLYELSFTPSCNTEREKLKNFVKWLVDPNDLFIKIWIHKTFLKPKKPSDTDNLG